MVGMVGRKGGQCSPDCANGRGIFCLVVVGIGCDRLVFSIGIGFVMDRCGPGGRQVIVSWQ